MAPSILICWSVMSSFVLRRGKNNMKLYRVEREAWAGTTSMLQSCPKEVLNVLLQFRSSTVQLREMGFKASKFLQQEKSPTNCTRGLSFNKSFIPEFRTRRMWKNDEVVENFDTVDKSESLFWKYDLYVIQVEVYPETYQKSLKPSNKIP